MGSNGAIILGFILGEVFLILMLAWTYGQLRGAGVFRGNSTARIVARLTFFLLPLLLGFITLPGVAARIEANQMRLPNTGASITPLAEAVVTLPASEIPGSGPQTTALPIPENTLPAPTLPPASPTSPPTLPPTNTPPPVTDTLAPTQTPPAPTATETTLPPTETMPAPMPTTALKFVPDRELLKSTPFPTPSLTIPSPTSFPSTPTRSALPDGKIVYVCQVYTDTNADQLCLIQPDGSGFRQLTDQPSVDFNFPSFSPDGSHILYSSNESGIYEIYRMDLQGQIEKLTGKLGFSAGDALAPELSPDGQSIVYTLRTDTHQGIWIMAQDGSNPRPLFGPPQANAWDPTWAPDGSRILFASDTSGGIQLFTIRPDGTELTQMTQIEGLRGRGDWASDGSFIATYRGESWNREVILMGADGSDPHSITTGGNNLSPAFSPDAQWLVFTSYRDRYGDDNGCEIYIMRPDGSDVQRLTDNPYCDWQPRWGR